MPAIDVLVVTGGHPFEEQPFFDVFDSMPGVRCTRATTPATGHDVVVFYDIPGLRFTRSDPPAEITEPTAAQRATIEQLCTDGTGLLFLHHAIAGWPSWEHYAEVIGGRFHYQPGVLRGRQFPDSGYRFDVHHTIEVLDTEHPVCAGLGESFSLTDELYCFPVFEHDVTPLLRTNFDTSDISAFSSADLAIRGRRGSNEGWVHPAGSRLVGWTRSVEAARLVYLQFGDGPQTYADPSFRLVVSNSIRWVARDAIHSDVARPISAPS